MKLEELCSKLKLKRQESGLSIEQVVDKTKLYPSVIKDIEEINLSNISAAYLKGFIKIYATFLGIETGDALEEIPLLHKVKEKPQIKKIKKEIKKIPPKIKKIIIFSLLGMFMLWFLITSVRFVTKKISKTFRKPKKANEKVVSNIPVPKVSSQEIIVSVTAKRKCFLRVKIDGEVLFQSSLDKDKKETWKATKMAELRISDGSAVYIEVNGKPILPLTSMRKAIKSLKITPTGISVDK
jgi:cytoskeletal protein RodZ